jgi:hypothetical protein
MLACAKWTAGALCVPRGSDSRTLCWLRKARSYRRCAGQIMNSEGDIIINQGGIQSLLRLLEQPMYLFYRFFVC